MASKTVFLIDTENVGVIWKELLTRKTAKDRIVLFFTEKSPHISYVDLEFICKYPDTFEMIQCYTGKNGLDFQLVSYLGYLLKSSPKAEYIILSNDCGFDPVIRFWTDREAIVSRQTVNDLKKSFQKSHTEKQPELVSAELSKKPSVNEDSNNHISSPKTKPDPKGLPAQNNPVEIITDFFSELTPETAANESAGNPADVQTENESETQQSVKIAADSPAAMAVAEYLPSEYEGNPDTAVIICTILRGNNISKLQKIYQTFLKKFGHTKGTQLYKALKPHIKSLYGMLEQQA